MKPGSRLVNLSSAGHRFSDVDLDDPDYELPDEGFPMRGIMRLGYRQLEQGLTRLQSYP